MYSKYKSYDLRKNRQQDGSSSCGNEVSAPSSHIVM